jgi:CheY-like chemotaxis protein
VNSALVIDDNRETADMLCQMLEYLGLRAHPAYGPRAALMEVSQEVPKVILLDISMPGIDGFEVMAFLSRDPRLAQVPVIVVTTDDQEETRLRSEQAGALDVLVKPISVASIEESLRKHHLINPEE